MGYAIISPVAYPLNLIQMGLSIALSAILLLGLICSLTLMVSASVNNITNRLGIFANRYVGMELTPITIHIFVMMEM